MSELLSFGVASLKFGFLQRRLTACLWAHISQKGKQDDMLVGVNSALPVPGVRGDAIPSKASIHSTHCYFFVVVVVVIFLFRSPPSSPRGFAGTHINLQFDLRAVDNLEPFSFPETEVIYRPRFVVVKCHKEGDSCTKNWKKQHQHLAARRRPAIWTKRGPLGSPFWIQMGISPMNQSGETFLQRRYSAKRGKRQSQSRFCQISAKDLGRGCDSFQPRLQFRLNWLQLPRPGWCGEIKENLDRTRF